MITNFKDYVGIKPLVVYVKVLFYLKCLDAWKALIRLSPSMSRNFQYADRPSKVVNQSRQPKIG